MVDKALVLGNRGGIMERKRKMQRTRAPGNNKKFCDGSSSQGLVLRPGQQQRMQVVAYGFQTSQQQIQRPNFQSPHSTPLLPQRNNNEQNPSVVGPCYNCG
jgi:hypothetical protein